MARRPKVLTREQLEGRKERAERFTRDVLEDPERADEISDESLESYAEGRGIELSNPMEKRTVRVWNPTKRRIRTEMARRSREELEDRVAELEAENETLQSENEELQGQIDEISDIVSGNGEENEEEEDDQD
jgi:hypothetical protein